MTDRVLNLLYLLFFVVAVLFLSWRDLRGNSYTPPAAFPYYAPVNASRQNVPDDNLSVTIAQGSFNYEAPAIKDGKALFTAAGLKPVSFPQREVNLQFRFEALPRTAEETADTLDKINTAIDSWNHQGNNVSGIYIEYTPEKPDLKAYQALAAAVKGKFRTEYVIGKSVVPSWLEHMSADEIQTFYGDGLTLLIVQPEHWNTPETIRILQKIRGGALFELPPGVFVDDVVPKISQQLSLMTFMVTLDPQRPVPRQGHKVGLFPHF